MGSGFQSGQRILGRRKALGRLGVMMAAAIVVGLIPGWARARAGGRSRAKEVAGIGAVKGGPGEMCQKVVRSEEEWRRILTPEEFHVLREKGTERAFTGKYHDFKGKGIYLCAGCGNAARPDL